MVGGVPCSFTLVANIDCVLTNLQNATHANVWRRPCICSTWRGVFAVFSPAKLDFSIEPVTRAVPVVAAVVAGGGSLKEMFKNIR